MKQYDKDIYLITPSVLEELLRQPQINPSIFLKGIKSQSIKGSIILTIDELEALWDAAHSNGEIDGLQSVEYMLGTETIDFETYIQSKGIQP
jgi:hypothetical protein